MLRVSWSAATYPQQPSDENLGLSDIHRDEGRSGKLCELIHERSE